MRRGAVALAVIAVAFVTSPSPASADGITQIEGLLEEPVLSTASRTAETRSAAPATSTIISAEDLTRYGIRSLDEAINFLSLGMFTQDPLHSVEIGARGVLLSADFGQHVLLLVDGHAMNEPWGGTAYFEQGAAIPFELIDHIEVIVGPGSVLYGSNAMLGVINVVTKRAKDYAGTHVVLDGRLPTAFRAGVGAGYSFKLFGRPAEITGQVEYYRQDGPAFVFGPQPYGTDAVTGQPKRFTPTGPATGIWGGTPSNAYHTQVPAAYVRFIAGDFEIALRSALYKRSTPYFDFTNLFAIGYDDPDSYEQDRWFSFDIKHKATLSRTIILASRVYGDAYDYRQRAVTYAAEDCLPGELTGCQRDYVGYATWLGAEERASFDWTGDGRFETQIGVEGRMRRVGSRLDVENRTTNALDGTLIHYEHDELAAAIYGQQVLRPVSWLALNGGARLDADQRFGSRVSPRLALVVNPWHDGALKVIYAEAFRAPSSYETSIADPAFQVQSPDLRPEITRSIEGLVEQKLGPNRIMAGVFRTYFTDMVLLASLDKQERAAAIARGDLSPGTTFAVQYKNVSSVDAYGFDGAFEGTALGGKLRYGLNATGAYARRTAEPGAPPEQLTVAPSFFGNARASYDLPGGLPTIALASWIASKRLADQAASFNIPPYAPPQVALRLTFSGALPVHKALSYRLSFEHQFGSTNPYVVGPNQFATPQQPRAELVPVVQDKAWLGLRYDLPF